jgi:hypothetical protein
MSDPLIQKRIKSMQQVTVPSSSRSSSAQVSTLHSSIRKALGNIDSRLEDELARYRRHRAGLSVQPSSVKAVQSPAQPRTNRRVDLASFAPIGSAQNAHASTGFPPSQATSLNPAQLDADTDAWSTPSSQIDPSDPTVQSAALQITETQYGSETKSEHGAIASAVAEEELDPSALIPDDYLASSEALLRSLAEEEARTATETNPIGHLMNPLGVGSMILMLLGSTMFGYLIMNPGSLGSIAEGLKQGMSRLTSAPSSSGGEVATQAPPIGNGLPAGSPVLDAQEFFNPSLDNLMALPGQAPSPLLSLTPSKPGAKGKNGTTASTSVPTNILGLSPTPSPLGSMTIGGSPSSNSNGNPAQDSNLGQVNGGGLFGNGGNSGGTNQPSAIATLPTTPLRRPSFPTYRPAAPAPSVSRPANYSPEPPATTPLPPAPPILPTSLPTVNVVPSNTNSTPAPSDAAPQAAGGSGYKVVVPYDNDRTLDQVQQVDSGAYFKNGDGGAVIQTSGSYGSEAEASAKVQELQQQGIQAEVQK